MREVIRGRLVIESPDVVSDDTGIVVEDGTILDVGKYEKVAARNVDAFVHDVDGIICPGMINAHTHLELSMFRREQFVHRDFVDWVLQLVEARHSASPENLHAECTNAKHTAEEQGTAYFVNVGSSYDINSSLGRNQLFQFEQIGINDSDSDRIYEKALSFIDEQNEVATALAIHAPYSVSPALMRKTKAYNNEHGLVTSIHLAETQDEIEFTRSGRGRMVDLLNRRAPEWKFEVPNLSPVGYVDSLGILDSKTLCVHCVFLNDDDLHLLRNRGCAVAICVRSNRELSGEVPDLRALMRYGIRILLGTDSKASSPDLNLLSEAASFYKEFHDVVSPAEVFRMATSNAAGFLGISDRFGSIAAGKRAFLVHVPFNGKAEDVFEFVVTEACGRTKALSC